MSLPNRGEVFRSVVRAVLLIIEALRVKRAGGSRCNAGENRKGDQSGNDGLHSFSPEVEPRGCKAVYCSRSTVAAV
jgi:hypothetical protein